MNKSKIAFVTMISISILLMLASGAYAYYQTTITGSVNGTVAAWSFKVNNQTDTFNIDLGNLYPGKEETINIVLSAENSSLDVYYEMWTGEGNKPHFYWDSSHNYVIGQDCNRQGKYGIIPAGSSVTIPVYYDWPYGNSPELDGYGQHVLSFNIIGRQYTGYSGDIPINLHNLDFFTSADGYFGDCDLL